MLNLVQHLWFFDLSGFSMTFSFYLFTYSKEMTNDFSSIQLRHICPVYMKYTPKDIFIDKGMLFLYPFQKISYQFAL